MSYVSPPWLRAPPDVVCRCLGWLDTWQLPVVNCQIIMYQHKNKYAWSKGILKNRHKTRPFLLLKKVWLMLRDTSERTERKLRRSRTWFDKIGEYWFKFFSIILLYVYLIYAIFSVGLNEKPVLQLMRSEMYRWFLLCVPVLWPMLHLGNNLT